MSVTVHTFAMVTLPGASTLLRLHPSTKHRFIDFNMHLPKYIEHVNNAN